MDNIIWNRIIANAADNGLVISDSRATSGYFTKELAARMKTQYLRHIIGGNMVRGGLTHLYISFEGMEDLRSQSVNLDKETRRRLLKDNDDGHPPELYGMEICPMSELGVGQSLQDAYTDLGGTYEDNDIELVIGVEIYNGEFVNCIAGSF